MKQLKLRKTGYLNPSSAPGKTARSSRGRRDTKANKLDGTLVGQSPASFGYKVGRSFSIARDPCAIIKMKGG